MFGSSVSAWSRSDGVDSTSGSDAMCRPLLHTRRDSKGAEERMNGRDGVRREHSASIDSATTDLLFMGRPLPHRFIVSWLMLVGILVLSLAYHVPSYTTSYVKRKAVLGHFLAGDYLGKESGDIVRLPTVFVHNRKDLFSRIEDFVAAFYELAAAAEAELKYHYYMSAATGKGTEFLRYILHGETPQRVEEMDRILTKEMNNLADTSEAETVTINAVTPVKMDVELFVFGSREHIGPSDTKIFSVTLTEEDPLGPFASEYRDWINGSSKTNDGEEEYSSRYSRAETSSGNVLNSPPNIRINTACAPRLSTLSGKYYSPCRRQIKGDAATNADVFFFSLTDNVRSIRLRGTLPQVIAKLTDGSRSTSGFSMIIYQWTIEVKFFFHRGGYVETTYNIISTAKHMQPRIHPRFLLTSVMFLLALLDMAIRFRALKSAISFRREAAAEKSREGGYSLPRAREGIGSGRKCHSEGTDVESSPSEIDGADSDRGVTMLIVKSLKRWVRHHADQWIMHRTSRPGARDSGPVGFMNMYEQWHHRLQEKGGDGWHFVGLVADLLILLYVSLFSVRLFGVQLSCFFDAVENMTLGVAAFFVCVNLLSQSRYFPEMYFNVQAMLRLISKLFLGMLSILPMFIGFVLFYCMVFGPHSDGRFTDVNYSFMTLYFMMFGDALVPAIASAGGSSFSLATFLANTVTVVYILLVIIALNLAMSITQYQWVRQRRKIGGKDTLLTFRTREDVRVEVLEDITDSIEVLLQLEATEVSAREKKTRSDVAASDSSAVSV